MSSAFLNFRTCVGLLRTGTLRHKTTTDFINGNKWIELLYILQAEGLRLNFEVIPAGIYFEATKKERRENLRNSRKN